MFKDIQAEKKAKIFLRDVMGRKNYNKFIEEGKIEIKSEGRIYELAIDGTVINKTDNQKYCIILAPGTSDRDDIPLFDLIAIKYSWLKHGTNIVEQTARKTYLDTSEPIGKRERTTYHDFVHYMENHGWRRKQLTIDEYNENIVSIHNVNIGEIGHIIEVKAPAENDITIMGTRQISRYHRFAHRFAIRLADTQNVEIASDTTIEIIKERLTEERIYIDRLCYGHINPTRNNLYTAIQRRNSGYYTFRNGILLHPNESIKVNVIYPDRDIKNVMFQLDLDFWIRR